jgi:hypothetical protein
LIGLYQFGPEVIAELVLIAGADQSREGAREEAGVDPKWPVAAKETLPLLTLGNLNTRVGRDSPEPAISLPSTRLL